MAIDIIRALLGWFLLFTLARGRALRLHGKFFTIPERYFDALHHGGMMILKLGTILVFFVAPYLALCIVG